MKHLFNLLIRSIPTIGVIAMLAHLIACALGVELYISELIVAMLVFALMWVISELFGYCTLYRAMLIYTFAAYALCCADVDTEPRLHLLQYLLIVIGVVLLAMLIRQKTCK